MNPIRVLIADDHPMLIEGLTSALTHHGVVVVDKVNSTNAVIEKYATSTADVLVLDVRFGEGATGLDVARELIQRYPAARICVYSQFDQNEVIDEAYRIGCAAFVTKNALAEQLADAIKQIHQGKRYFMPEIAQRLAERKVEGDDSPQAKLSPRELEVFKLMAEGLTNAEIAERMNLSPKTISTTSQSVKEQLRIHRPADITRLAIKHMLIDP